MRKKLPKNQVVVPNTLVGSDPIFVKRIEDNTERRFVVEEDGSLRPFKPRSKYMEVIPFVKFYCDPEFIENFCALLSNSAKSMFMWIMFEIKSGEDVIEIDYPKYASMNNIRSLTTAKKAVEELVHRKFLQETNVRDVFYINPWYAFKGSRTRKYKSNVKIVRPERKVNTIVEELRFDPNNL